MAESKIKNPVAIISGTATPNTTYIQQSSTLRYVKFGRLVIVNISSMVFISDATNTVTIASGFPRPMQSVEVSLSSFVNKNVKRLVLSSTTNNLTAFWDNISSGDNLYGSFAYISAE